MERFNDINILNV